MVSIVVKWKIDVSYFHWHGGSSVKMQVSWDCKLLVASSSWEQRIRLEKVISELELVGWIRIAAVSLMKHGLKNEGSSQSVVS